MNRQNLILPWATALSLLVSVSVLVGCTSDPPRYPESHDRFERIVEAVNSLRTAYVEQNPRSINDLLLPLDTLRNWEQSIQRDFQTYAEIDVDLSIDRMLINGDLISVQVSWQGEWKETAETAGVKARGHGTLHWSGTHVILLTGTAGDLPFGMADRQAMS